MGSIAGGVPIECKLPVRTNVVTWEKTARDATPDTSTTAADMCGWVTVALDTTPKFIKEPVDSTLKRPDVIIDSLWTDPEYPRDGDTVAVYAKVENIDAIQSTPDTVFVEYYNSDTLLCVDTIIAEIKPESTYVSCVDSAWVAEHGYHLLKAVVNPSMKKFVEHSSDNNAGYRLYQVLLRPYGSISINMDSAYTNIAYAVLNLASTNPNDTLNPPADSMKMWQFYGDSLSLIDSTGWLAFDSTYCWLLRQDEGTQTVYVMYKVGANNESYEYSDQICFDKTAPTYSFVINYDSTFTNNPNVTLKSFLSDGISGPSKMRYGNNELKNPVINSSFESDNNWRYDYAVFDSTLKLYDISVQTSGNYFYQAIPPESLSSFEGDTMLLWIDLVIDDFIGTGRIEFQYIYGDTAVRHIQPIGCSITIPKGTNAKVAQYNLYSYFEFRPDSDSVFTEARIGVWVNSGLGNNGDLYIDNFRLDLVGPPYDYTKFENYDSLKSWTLISGNGVRKVWGQFADCAGNETSVSFDSIIVDTTKPARKVAYPQNGQTISDTISITGWAHDSLEDPPHFKQYELQHQQFMDIFWYGNDPDSLSFIPKYPIQVGGGFKPVKLGDWNTYQVNDGWYNLKLTVADSASNISDTMVSVRVRNDGGGIEGFSGFSNYIYGIAVGEDVYIGEFVSGNIYHYDVNHEIIDTITVNDSLGTGFPFALLLDDTGTVWVANVNSHLISRYTPQGDLILRFAGNFNMPSGICLDPTGNIWISDRLHHKIKKFNKSGDSLYAFGAQGADPGEIDRPIGLAYYNGKIFIADSRNKRISVFDTLGNFVEIFADSTVLTSPFDIVIDSTGCLFVSDILAHDVLEFDPFGNQLFKIDTLLNYPSSLALSPNANFLYVSDTKNKRVMVYEVRGEPGQGGGPQSQGDNQFIRSLFEINPSVAAGRMIIKIHGFIGATVNLTAYDITGRVVRTFFEESFLKTNQNITWDGRDDLNRKLPNGIYFLRFETDDCCKTEKTILLK